MNLASPLPLSFLNGCPGADARGLAKTPVGPDGLGLARTQRDPGEPLVRAFQPFPVESFPVSVRNYVTSVAAAMDCDAAFVALPVLSVLAAAIGNSHRLSIKKCWSEPAVVWTALVSDGRTDTRQAMDAATAPFGLQMRRSLVRDGRLTALIPTLEREQRGLLMRLDHLDGWLGRPNSTSARRLGEVSQWADIHGSRPISMERRGREIEISAPAVSLLGTVQRQVLSDKFLKARVPCELTSRLLFAAPPSQPRRWTEDDVSEEVDRAYKETVAALWLCHGKERGWPGPPGFAETPGLPSLRSTSPGHPTQVLEFDGALARTAADTSDVPPGMGEGPVGAAIEVPLSAEARTLFGRFIDWVGREQCDVDEVLAPWFTQLTSQAVRLALVVHLTRCAEGESIDRWECDVASLRAGIAMAKWFAQEAQRVIAVFSVGRDEQEQQRILEWIRGRGGLATSRDLCRSNGRRYPTDEMAQQALDQLAESGAGQWVDFPPGKNGGRGYRAFSLGPVDAEPVPERKESGDESPHSKVEPFLMDDPVAADLLVKFLVREVVSDKSGEIGSKRVGAASEVMPQRASQGCVGQKLKSRKMKRRAGRKAR